LKRRSGGQEDVVQRLAAAAVNPDAEGIVLDGYSKVLSDKLAAG
jgi:folate-dependent phosphoribosylglycinamide formyltransferase PurN